jgi:hypothetical protein
MAALDDVPNGRPHPGTIEIPDLHAEHDFDLPTSPLQLQPGQIDGLAELQKENRMMGHLSPRSEAGSLFSLRIPGVSSTADLAMAAMQYLPTPLLVLSSLKTVVMANEAMGRLMGLDHAADGRSDSSLSVMDMLRGKSLSQIGVDMLQDGRPVWMTWENFFDSLLDDMQPEADEMATSDLSDEGDVTPTAEKQEPRSRQPSAVGKNSSTVHDSVVEVVITPEQSLKPQPKGADMGHVFAKMIITVWDMEDATFFTLTFTSTDTNQKSLPNSRGESRTVTRASTHHTIHLTGTGSGDRSSPSSVSSGHSSTKGSSSNSSSFASPITASLSVSPFPPLGPPTRMHGSTPSSLQKITLMKDALLDSTDLAILAMWKDESLIIPNKGKSSEELTWRLARAPHLV